jgi:transposase
MSARSAGRLFAVSGSTAVKWAARWQTGSASSKRMGGYKVSPLDAHADVLLALNAEQPDLTVDEFPAELRGRGIRASRGSVWRFFERHGISFKKNRARRRAEPSRRGGGAARLGAPSAVA